MSNNKILKDGLGVEFTTKTSEDVAGINTSHVNVDSLPIQQPLTDAQLRASSLPVSGPLTDAQIRATALPVTGPLTDSQLRATPIDMALPNGVQINGPLAQSVINTDLLTGNINGWYDAASFQSGAIQIIASAGISAGQIFFEQTNDNTSSVGLPLLHTEAIAINSNPNNAAFAIAASANRLFKFAINARYIRVRISTAFVGGIVRAIGFFSDFPFAANVINVQQGVNANLQVNAGINPGTTRIGAIAGAGIWYDDSSTVLAAAATFTGISRDLTVTATATAFANAATYAQELRVSAESDQTGTLWLEVSRDNTTWRRVKSIATTAVTGGGFYAEINHLPSWRYARVGFTNGATLQTRFTINSILLAS